MGIDSKYNDTFPPNKTPSVKINILLSRICSAGNLFFLTAKFHRRVNYLYIYRLFYAVNFTSYKSAAKFFERCRRMYVKRLFRFKDVFFKQSSPTNLALI